MSVFPCDWCSRTGQCPCVTEPMQVRRAMGAVNARHKAAVALRRESARQDRPRRAA